MASKLDALYKIYGYSVAETNRAFRVYMLAHGVYHGVDIVRLDKNEDVSSVIKTYSESGYATKLRDFGGIENIESELFRSFFSHDSSRERLVRRIQSYEDARSKSLGVGYEYISCGYEVLSGVKNGAESIVDFIVEKVFEEGTNLVIVEAAAGYGKTSTIYEVLKKVVAEKYEKCPLLAELSRNRQARIFKYVLLDEIDREYPSLRSTLVEHEIKKGRIPLVIDGFDELLQRSTSANGAEEDFESVEAMLETISMLMSDSAKVILTSRSTAIFSGDKFLNWINEKSETFKTTRLLLQKPDAVQWLGHERLKILQANGIPVEHISNPVLLAFLRSIQDHEFSGCCQDAESVVDKFFNSLLAREQERQHLRINEQEQLEIYENLAGDFVSYGITAEEKDFISQLIMDRNQQYLYTVRSRYDHSMRPSVEELVETLTNHALLDRIGSGEERIAFINQYVFGHLIGGYCCRSDDDWILDSFSKQEYVEMAAIAYAARSQHLRSILYEKISLVDFVLDGQQKLVVDNVLVGLTTRSFEASSFDELNLKSFVFDEGSKFQNCYFSDCLFDRVVFCRSSFVDCLFVNCKFSNCICRVDCESDNLGCAKFIGCVDYNDGFIDAFSAGVTPAKVFVLEATDYNLKVLQQFWPVGRPHAVNSRKLRTLYAGFKHSETECVDQAIKRLASDGLITIDSSFARLNTSRMNEIRKLLNY